MSMETSTEVADLQLSRESFQQFASFITQELGIQMSDSKVPMLQSRLMRRLRELKLRNLDEYREFLFHSPHANAERIQFFDVVTTNKTDFFREPQHFEYLTRTALPALGKTWTPGAAWRFKLWCAGCSSGEEPYTQAMVLSEYAKSHPGFDFSVFATDISTKVLQHAANGIYEESRIEPVPMALRKLYWLRSKDPQKALARVSPELRKKVTFHRLNFMDAEYRVREMFEVIFFRNVMIYFNKPTQESVINKLCRNLRPGGFLFVGHSESLAGLNIPVAQVGTSVFRKPT